MNTLFPFAQDICWEEQQVRLCLFIYLFNCLFSVIPRIKYSSAFFAIIYLMWYLSMKISTLPFSGWEYRLEKNTSFSYGILSTANFISLAEKCLHGTDELFGEKIFPALISPWKITHRLAWNRTRNSLFKGQRVTVWTKTGSWRLAVK